MRSRPTRRPDGTAQTLIAAARQMGLEFVAHDGTCDGNLWVPSTGRVWIVDFKSKGGLMTPSQQKLVMRKCPIEFLSDVAQLEALVRGSR